jgi:lysozyme
MALRPVHVIAALGAAFALMWARSARAYAPSVAEPAVPYGPGIGDGVDDWLQVDDTFAGPIYEGDPMNTAYDDALADANVRAFLYLLRNTEHTRSDAATGRAYSTFYGGAQFKNLADHPVLTGEMRGVQLPAKMCVAAGFADGICVSTAAGAYQFIVPTWNNMRGISPRLPDFSPASQDVAAVRLLRKIGALEPLQMGNLDAALRKASSQWASLPYSTAQQNPKSLQTAVSLFAEGLHSA